MKTNKITTYLLLVTACAVWGIVAYRFLRPAPAPGSPAPAMRPPAAATTRNSRIPAPGYPDPFLKELPPDPSAQPPPVQKTSGDPAGRQPPKEKTALTCRGTITKNNIYYYLLMIDGIPCMLRSGDTAQGFKLLPPDGDSLTLVKKGNAYRIKAVE